MAIKKSALYSFLWKSCDELRGGMDASQYKDYVLALLFVKYVSDKYEGQKDSMLEVPEDGSFHAMVGLKGHKEIGDKVNKIIGSLLTKNGLESKIKVADFADENLLGKGREMVDRLSKLIGIFEGLDFRRNRIGGDDLLGDAYEYLMRNFATQSGKSKGQFYTPAEVSRIMAKVIGIGNATSQAQTIHDPTCGSGSLLLKAHDEAKSRTGYDLAMYGQEMDNSNAALAQMNMILHGCPTAEIEKGNTLASPQFKDAATDALKRFDFAVANPPFSTKSWSNGIIPELDDFSRFAYGVPPEKNGDYAFLLHIIAALNSSGKGAIILPHGVLFRGNAEADIRRNIVQQGYIKGIIGLPSNLFYGTGIPACIIVLDKENALARKGIFFLDASRDFVKDGNKNRLREQDIHKIVDTFTNQKEIAQYSRLVPLSEISDPKNDFNLNIPRYIDSSAPEDLQDIEAHLRGGIPNRDIDALESYWKVLPDMRSLLFAPADRAHYSQLTLPTTEIKSAVFHHAEFITFNQGITALFEKWRDANIEKLKGINKETQAHALIEGISEDLLTTFLAAPLLDAYDVYQHLMSYWDETLQDDVHSLIQDGWVAIIGNQPNTELIPEILIENCYFPAEQAEVRRLEAVRDAITQQMEELEEEHGDEDGLLADAKTDKGKYSRISVQLRLNRIREDKDADDERKLLKEYLALIEKERQANQRVRDAKEDLRVKVGLKYGELSEAEIKSLVVDDKWLTRLAADVQSELDRTSQALTGRVQQLSRRYATSLPTLTAEVDSLAARVAEHLQRMEAAWN